MKLFFLIRILDHGGAERQLIELVKALDKSRFKVTVATFYDGGGLWSELENLPGVRLVSLGKKGRWDVPAFVWRLARLVRAIRPEVLHGYMGIANELCSLMGWLYGGRVVWGIRESSRPPTQYDWLSRWSGRAGAWLSRSADVIIANAHAGQHHCLESGFFAERITVVHNGIDTERFQPDRAAGRALRAAWGVADDELLVGLIARLDPQKDHRTFLRAAALVVNQRPKVRFVCVGNGPAAYTRELSLEAHQLGLNGCLRWVPAANNVQEIYNALDLATLTSMNGEGFPNVVGEAMACGVPVVVTDNGDAAFVVGEKEQVVPCGQPAALAAAWLRVLALNPAARVRLGARQRARIEDHFQIRHLVEKTLAAIRQN